MNAIQSLVPDLEAVLKLGRGLPGCYFTDERVLNVEREILFGNSWFCIGLSDDVPRRGDLVPIRAAGNPLLMVRDETRLRVFHNVCSHRGAILLDKAAHGIRIVCPYHSWTYTLSGSLVATPHVGGDGQHGCPELSAKNLGLRDIRCAEWAGHVFVNLSGTAPDFDTWMAPVRRRFEYIDWSELRHDRAQSRELQVAANWKIIAENFVESYHLPWVHPALNSVNPMRAHYQILGGLSYLGQGGTGYEGDSASGRGRPMMKRWADRSCYEAIYIFPNLILSPLADMTFSIILRPERAEQTDERVSFFFAGDEALAPDYSEGRSTGAEFIANVNAEDVQIVESVQRGRHSPAFAGGHFSDPQEATSRQLQQVICARLLSTHRGMRPEDLIDLPFRDIPHATSP